MTKSHEKYGKIVHKPYLSSLCQLRLRVDWSYLGSSFTIIWEIKTRDLADKINMHSNLLIKNRYKNYIYEKHIIYPFNKTKAREQETLKRIHIDI